MSHLSCKCRFILARVEYLTLPVSSFRGLRLVFSSRSMLVESSLIMSSRAITLYPSTEISSFGFDFLKHWPVSFDEIV